MKIATYNVEWFYALFDDDGQLMDDDAWSARYNITRKQQIAAVGRVFQALDADAIMVVEAPDMHNRRNGLVALENFAARFSLRAREAVIGFSNDTQQEIIFLFDPDRISARHDPKSSILAPRFDQSLAIDIDVDTYPDPIVFSKPPLELYAEGGNSAFRLIGVHAKSKAPHGARNAQEEMRISIANRRKQLAQCIWLRRRIDDHLAEDEDVIVLGDFNDGPGLDEYEKLFGSSGIEIVMGEGKPAGEQLFDPHAQMALSSRVGATVSTARFFLHHENRYLSALLDYIMLSPGLMSKRPHWCIWHPFDNAECFADPGLQSALLDASDHFPVTLEIDL